MTKQLITAETSSKPEVRKFNTLMGLGTPAHCVRFANPAEAHVDKWPGSFGQTVSSNDENASKPGKASRENTLLGNGTRLDVSAGCAVNRIQLGQIIYIVLLILTKILG